MKIIEIDGIKYSLTPIEETKPDTLYNLIVEWVNDDDTPPVKELVDRIESWLPEQTETEEGGDEWYVAWNSGYNTYRKLLLEKLR